MAEGMETGLSLNNRPKHYAPNYYRFPDTRLKFSSVRPISKICFLYKLNMIDSLQYASKFYSYYLFYLLTTLKGQVNEILFLWRNLIQFRWLPQGFFSGKFQVHQRGSLFLNWETRWKRQLMIRNEQTEKWKWFPRVFPGDHILCVALFRIPFELSSFDLIWSHSWSLSGRPKNRFHFPRSTLVRLMVFPCSSASVNFKLTVILRFTCDLLRGGDLVKNLTVAIELLPLPFPGPFSIFYSMWAFGYSIARAVIFIWRESKNDFLTVQLHTDYLVVHHNLNKNYRRKNLHHKYIWLTINVAQ